ncbi:MAG: RNA pyrophosphohydrolase [Holosporales bacterium]|jgi:putative (di)nucleoside polyphosphate hydrolase|nr:RNA pyrophosphohydrolase [Holosporales bacterium]
MSEIDKNRFRSGVGMVLMNNDKKIFAGKKSAVNAKMISWFLNKPWQMPQGGIEKDETPIDAALRELKEETGVDKVEVVSETENWLEYVIPHSLRRKGYKVIGQRQKWFLFKFLGKDSDINLNTTNHSEFDVWRWMSAANILRLSVHFKRNLYSEVLKNFQKYLDLR